MTKQDLINLVTTNFADASNITAAELRQYTDALLDAFYPASVTDSQATETYTTKSGTNFNYNLKLTKSGNLLYVDLSYSVIGTNILSARNIFVWKNTNPTYQIDNTLSQQMTFSIGGLNAIVPLFLSNNVIATQANTQPGITYYANFVLKLRN